MYIMYVVLSTLKIFCAHFRGILIAIYKYVQAYSADLPPQVKTQYQQI